MEELFPIHAQAIIAAQDSDELAHAAWRYACVHFQARYKLRRVPDLAREVIIIQVERYIRQSPYRRSLGRRAVGKMVVAADRAVEKTFSRSSS